MKKIIRVFIKLTGFLSAILYFKPKITYIDKKKFKKDKKGNVIIASNHINALDFVLFLLIFWNRNIRCLVGETLYNRNKLLKWLLDVFESIKVERLNYDMSFLAKSVSILKSGGMIEIYPEALFSSRNNELNEFKLSATYIAYHANSKIIPIYHAGNYGILKRERVVIGNAIDVRKHLNNANPSLADFKRINDILEDEIKALKQKTNKGV